MLEFEEALGRILAAVPAPANETILLAAAAGRVLAEPVHSALDLPLFDNSAMDGYAVSANDFCSAKAESPVKLRLVGRIAAGESFDREVGPGECVRLFTGSPLPRGADAVVMQEDTKIEPNQPQVVSFLDAPKPWESVRLQGEDIKRGQVVGAAGDVLTPGRLSLLAATGTTRVNVGRQPKVAILATGSELQETGQELAPGQIYESNRIGLVELTRRAGALPKPFPLIADTIAATTLSLIQALDQCDVVVTSGGASVGEMDFVKQAFAEGGGQLEFWKVAIKPGRPFIFGRRGAKLLFGLPGNPVSAFVTFLLLARPALLRWQGASEISLPCHPGILAEPLSNHGPRRHFMRVKVDATGKVSSAGLQASHAISSLATANALVDVAPDSSLPAGTQVQVMRWDF